MPIGLDWNHCHPRIYLPGPAPGAGRYCSGDAEGGRRAAYAAGLTGDGRNVQVFPNTETLQELELIPLPEQTSSSTRGEIVDIPPQDL